MQSGYQTALEVADKSAAAFGVEPRYPFFDRRLIEFCVGLPEEQKFDRGWPRLLFRRAMDGILPPEIQWRSWKANLSPNFQRRFRDVDFASRSAMGSPVLARYIREDRLQDLIHLLRIKFFGKSRVRAKSDAVSLQPAELHIFYDLT